MLYGVSCSVNVIFKVVYYLSCGHKREHSSTQLFSVSNDEFVLEFTVNDYIRWYVQLG